uniref:Uncharacterized protein n=1 Tax=Pipistrellus kuhlii TaxID=59472 RepID=A0A7J7WDZ5_PIPKU|nr:hypothetical protein mPipKuh1_008073 [Pipistrellus kuhlii]
MGHAGSPSIPPSRRPRVGVCQARASGPRRKPGSASPALTRGPRWGGPRRHQTWTHIPALSRTSHHPGFRLSPQVSNSTARSLRVQVLPLRPSEAGAGSPGQRAPVVRASAHAEGCGFTSWSRPRVWVAGWIPVGVHGGGDQSISLSLSYRCFCLPL